MRAEFKGEFETHLTVRLDAGAGGAADDTAEFARLEQWARALGLKLTRILLDRGATPDQPMLTEGGRGSLTALRAAARLRSEALASAGFPVVRVKIEAAPWNEDVPRTAAEAAALSPVCHFEHHIKLLLRDGPDLALARAVAGRHSAHLSRNARRTVTGGRHERFVTQRCRGVGRPGARTELDALLASLNSAGLDVLECEEEFVVYDDCPAVDAGWMEERSGAAV
ncbi:hypothetical protein [Streptomyces sp. ITFR-16]|uniref:hypothetical protein n=1 Tax=Streptomyces sp. ITFR-16 TaxID=3075198 RepID=UPI00288BB2F6|nr:hypothetical protein [Streptomyces sp. ITFR-16]WNI21354.1 hypothetical protein RLT58_05180 [Streptomyces sp. ITFR-16]